MPVSKENKNQFIAVRSMFLAGSVSRMRDIEKIEPTKIAKALHINHSRYIAKLHKPEGFTFGHIRDFALLLDLDIQVIIDIIKKDMAFNVKQSKKITR